MKTKLSGLALLIVNVALISGGVIVLSVGLDSEVAKGLWIFTIIMNGIMIVPNFRLAFDA